jgi:hypothetical protein
MNTRNLFETALCTIFVLAANSIIALGQNEPAAYSSLADNGEISPASFSETMAEQPQGAGCHDVLGSLSAGCPRWTASAEFLIFDRIGGGNQTLVEKLPSSVRFVDIANTSGDVVLTGNDFQGFSGGARVGMIRHGDSGYDCEFSYFQIDGWDVNKRIGPDSPPDWLVMRAPGNFIQTNQPPFDIQSMDWNYASQLHNAEFNVRWNPSNRVTLLAGLRWMNLQEHLVGALEPPTISWEPPFWNGTTSNNLFGIQIGADGKIFERGRFSIGGLVKAGIFDNNASQTTAVSVIFKQVRTASASTNHASFVGETGLQCKYQVTKGLVLKAGYEVIWLQGVALAPGQVQETEIDTHIIAAQALGINCNSGMIYHGATAGLEYSF